MALGQNNPPFELLEGYTSVAEHNFETKTGTYSDGVDEYVIENTGQSVSNAAHMFMTGSAAHRNYLYPIDDDWIAVMKGVIKADLDTGGPVGGTGMSIGSNRIAIDIKYIQTAANSPTAGVYFRIRTSGGGETPNPRLAVQQGSTLYFKTKFTASTNSYELSILDDQGTVLFLQSSDTPYGTPSGHGHIPYAPTPAQHSSYPSGEGAFLNFDSGDWWIAKNIAKDVTPTRSKPIKLLGKRTTGRRSKTTTKPRTLRITRLTREKERLNGGKKGKTIAVKGLF